MNCCKESKYNLLLLPSFTDINSVTNTIANIMGWSISRAKTAVETTNLQGFCLLQHDSVDNLTKLSLKLAEGSIPHKITKSKK